jgi:hypothetical protein
MSSDVYTGHYPNRYPYAATFNTSGVGLVSNAMKGIEGEYVAGLKVEFDLFFHHYKWYIWKRTYHLLDGYDIKSAADYVYDYVN